MITWFKTYVVAFFWDPTAFVRYTRAGIYALYVFLQTYPNFVTSTKFGWYVTQLIPAVALFMGAGEKNEKKETTDAGGSGTQTKGS